MRGKVDITNPIVVHCRYSYEYFCALKIIKNKIVSVKPFFLILLECWIRFHDFGFKSDFFSFWSSLWLLVGNTKFRISDINLALAGLFRKMMRITRSITIKILSWKKNWHDTEEDTWVFSFSLYSSQLVTCIHLVYDTYQHRNSCEVLVSAIVKHESRAKSTWYTSKINKLSILSLIAIGFRIKTWVFLYHYKLPW